MSTAVERVATFLFRKDSPSFICNTLASFDFPEAVARGVAVGTWFEAVAEAEAERECEEEKWKPPPDCEDR